MFFSFIVVLGFKSKAGNTSKDVFVYLNNMFADIEDASGKQTKATSYTDGYVYGASTDETTLYLSELGEKKHVRTNAMQSSSGPYKSIKGDGYATADIKVYSNNCFSSGATITLRVKKNASAVLPAYFYGSWRSN